MNDVEQRTDTTRNNVRQLPRTVLEKIVLTVMAFSADVSGCTAPTRNFLARETGLSRSEVAKAMRRLGPRGKVEGRTFVRTPVEEETVAAVIDGGR